MPPISAPIRHPDVNSSTADSAPSTAFGISNGRIRSASVRDAKNTMYAHIFIIPSAPETIASPKNDAKAELDGSGMDDLFRDTAALSASFERRMKTARIHDAISWIRYSFIPTAREPQKAHPTTSITNAAPRCLTRRSGVRLRRVL